MSNLAKLREEHAELAAIVRRLSDVIAKDSPPRSPDFHALRRELQSKLIAHLKAEDWMLYRGSSTVLTRTSLAPRDCSMRRWAAWRRRS